MRSSIMLPIVRMLVNVDVWPEIGDRRSERERERESVVPVAVYTHADSERFIFSGLSNHRGRYLHARPAINGLISVSFHL